METKQNVLVLGASGGIGGELARQLHDNGWQVRALQRNPPAAGPDDGIVRLQGDALNPGDVAAAAQGCAVIVHAVNPPGYQRWAELVLPMLDNTLAAARSVGATVVLPGTVYNYGPDAFPVIAEDAEQRPFTRKGAIRVEMERRLRVFAEQGGRVLIVRAGDFFGPQAGNNWFAQGLVKPGQPVATISNPGRVGHQWSYLPDVASAVVRLLERRATLPPFSNFHMAGHWDADGRQMAEAIRRVLVRNGAKAPKISAFPWWLIQMLSPFNTTCRELLEMRYLWRQPVRMSNTKLTTVLGHEPMTPLDVAVEATLRGLKCLPAAN
jgi:nucleoside-diphosphate-sugar epimerase